MTDEKASADSQAQPELTVALELPSAQLLADQIATITDLQFVMECCKRLLSELVKPEEEQDPVVPQALWSPALTAYDLSFARVKRFGLTVDDVKALPLEGQVVKFHEWAVNERNVIGRHPTNPFDEARVGAGLCHPRADRQPHPGRRGRGAAARRARVRAGQADRGEGAEAGEHGPGRYAAN